MRTTGCLKGMAGIFLSALRMGFHVFCRTIKRPDLVETRMQEKNDDQPALGKLPVFFDLHEKSCLLAADNNDAIPKARLLISAGARLALFVCKPEKELQEFCDQHQDRAALHHRACTLEDLEHAFLAVGAFSDEQAAIGFSQMAREARVPVNLVDRPSLCDFQVPSIVNRTPLIVGISTGGIAPVIGQWLRGRIEILLPSDTGRILSIAARFRSEVLKTLPKLQNRRRFWRRIAEDDLPHMTGCGEDHVMQRLRDRLQHIVGETGITGSVERIIADGNPDHLRLGQLRALQNADTVVSLQGVNPLYIDFVRRDADRIQDNELDESLARALAAARSGKSVIWLAPSGADDNGDKVAAACAAEKIRYRNEN